MVKIYNIRRWCLLGGKENREKNCNLANCTEFKEEKCNLLNKPPYVCNGCKNKMQCTLTKHFYDAIYANDEYISTLSEVRSGVMIYQEEIDTLNDILTPLICEKNQSFHQALLNNKNIKTNKVHLYLLLKI